MSFDRDDPQRFRVYDAEDTVWKVPTIGIKRDGTEQITRQPRVGWVLAPHEDWSTVGVTRTPTRQAAIKRLRTLVNAVVASDWWRAAGGPAEVDCQLKDRWAASSRGGKYPGGYGIRQSGDVKGLSAMVVAHELGHVLDKKVNGSWLLQPPDHRAPLGSPPIRVRNPGHGPLWAGGYVRLTDLVLGFEAGAALRVAFDTGGVVVDEGWCPPVRSDHRPILTSVARMGGWDWIEGVGRSRLLEAPAAKPTRAPRPVKAAASLPPIGEWAHQDRLF